MRESLLVKHFPDLVTWFIHTIMLQKSDYFFDRYRNLIIMQPIIWYHLGFICYSSTLFPLEQISNFVIGLYFLSVLNKFGIGTVYLGFASVCLLAVVYISRNVVETKGRSLEEIERALSPAIWNPFVALFS